MKHQLKPLAYMRYGDDWLCFVPNRQKAVEIQDQSTIFLKQQLHLTINPKLNNISQVIKGVSYLGVNIWPDGRRLQPSVRVRVSQKITLRNTASYRSLVAKNEKTKAVKKLNWKILEFLDI